MAPDRHIDSVIPAVPVDVDGLAVRQPLPHAGLRYLDPFLLLHHGGPFHLPGGYRPQELGVPPHPHRGFEPVTFVFRGGMHHRDSRGHDGVVHADGVQWLTAGMGIVHSERPPRELAEAGGVQEFVQLWVNLPARLKMVQPRYQAFEAGDLPVLREGVEGGVLKVVAGESGGVPGPVQTHSPLQAVMGELAAGGAWRWAPPAGWNAFVYLLDGECEVNGERAVSGARLLQLGTGDGAVRLVARTALRLVAAAGRPLNEPVMRSGPYVMNTHTQILEAMRDAQMGRMGVLIETF